MVTSAGAEAESVTRNTIDTSPATRGAPATTRLLTVAGAETEG